MPTFRPLPNEAIFIRAILAADVREGVVSEVVTRFPPEPNGYLHIGLPQGDRAQLRIRPGVRRAAATCFDDPNPIKEEQEYIDSIQEDIRWLGFDWGEHLSYASDYFHRLYDWVVHPTPMPAFVFSRARLVPIKTLCNTPIVLTNPTQTELQFQP